MKHRYKEWGAFSRAGSILRGSLLVATCSFFSWAYAQVSTLYTYTQLNGTYTPITGGTVLGTATNDDQRFVDPAVLAGGTVTTGVGFPIGFDFVYNGNTYDRLAINSNGWISLGSSLLTPSVNNASTSAYTPLSSTSTTTPTHLRSRISAMGRDLQGQATGELRLETIGTAPNRVCVIQWTDYKRFGTTGTGDDLNFQIRLYETSNMIQTVYETVVFGTTSSTAHVGLGGTTSTDYNNRLTTTDWNATTAGTANTSGCTMAAAATPPVSGLTMIWGIPPATPPTPTQEAGIPSCATGSDLDVVGTPETDVIWYWQSSASGTSTANPYSGPYPVFANGTYYLRAYNTATTLWSANASSVDVTNFPVATNPPAPVPAENPACVTTGTTFSVAAAPAGYEYYWQGTDMNGFATTDNASTPYPVSASGTYYVRAYETATQCWSDAIGASVVVNTFIPLDPIGVTPLNVCNGSPSAMVEAINPDVETSISTTQAGGNGCGNGAMFDITSNAAPVTITALDVTPNATSTQNVNVYYVPGGYVGNETNMGAWTLVGTYSITGTAGTPINVDIDDFTIPASTTYGIYVNYNAQYSNLATTYSDSYVTITTGAGFCTAFSGPIAGRTFNGTIYYLIPSSASIVWYDALTGGTQLGTGSPFESVGTSVLPNTTTNGAYSFYAASEQGGCYGTNRALVTVNVTNVNAEIIPIDVNCNNYSNGSFALGTVDCGQAPFTYSIDGGAFGPVPTNLAPGTHTVVIRDGNNDDSPAYTIEILEAEAPSDAFVISFNNDEATISWAVNASETSWNIEWGAPGFTPGTGTEIGSTTASNDTITISGLDGNTTYDFYISADCGAGATVGSWTMTSFTTLCDPYTIPFAETFEDTSATLACWTNVQEVGAGNWTFQTGSSGGTVLTAFEGSKNARFVSSSGASTPITKLTSPLLLTQNQDSVAVVFAYAQEVWAGDQNITKVYSRSGSSNPWVEIMSYDDNVAVWTVDTLYAPAQNDTVEIAFEGINNFGRANVVDHVQIFPCSVAPGTDGAQDVCRLSGTVDLNTVITPGETWGKWYFPLNQGLISNGSILNPASLPDGTYEFFYVLETPCVNDTTFAELTIYGASSAGNNGILSACMNQPINLLGGLSGNVDLGGTWYDPSGAAIGNGYITTGQLAGQFNYNYVTGNGVCPNDTSNVIMNILPCDWLGLDDLNLDGIAVYPNPTSGIFYISNMENGQSFAFEVLDLNGRKVIAETTEVMAATETEVNLTNLENGIYLIRLFNKDGEKMVRIVKN